MRQDKRFRVRFHLGKGPNYMTWQVIDKKNGYNKDYYNPEGCSIHMVNCVFGNNPTIAQKIYDGDHKTVCAWVDCDDLDVSYVKSPDYVKPNTKNMMKYRYNPRKAIHWNTNRCYNVDGKKVKHLYTHNMGIYG